MIYTRSEAAQIVELFEDVLDKHNVKIPSPEDDEREDDNDAKLYGSTYYGLLDSIEDALVSMLDRAENGEAVEPYRFSS